MPELASVSIPKHDEIVFRCDPFVFFKLMLDAILKVARPQGNFGCDAVGAARSRHPAWWEIDDRLTDPISRIVQWSNRST